MTLIISVVAIGGWGSALTLELPYAARYELVLEWHMLGRHLTDLPAFWIVSDR